MHNYLQKILKSVNLHGRVQEPEHKVQVRKVQVHMDQLGQPMSLRLELIKPQISKIKTKLLFRKIVHYIHKSN